MNTIIITGTVSSRETIIRDVLGFKHEVHTITIKPDMGITVTGTVAEYQLNDAGEKKTIIDHSRFFGSYKVGDSIQFEAIQRSTGEFYMPVESKSKSQQKVFCIVDSSNCAIDVATTMRGAMSYATRNGYKRVAVRFPMSGYVYDLAEKKGSRWVKTQYGIDSNYNQ